MRRFLVTVATLLAVAFAATACGDTAPNNTVANITATDDTAPDDTTPGDTAPDDTAPDDTATNNDEQPLGAGPYPIADLTVAAYTDGSDNSTGSVYRLACLGDTATLTGDSVALSADSMCLTLNDDSVRTRLIDGFPDEMACTMQYGGPELAVITGTLDGQPVDTTVDRTNGCGIAEWTGLLGHLLPPPSA
jgi:hypothetical protein